MANIKFHRIVGAPKPVAPFSHAAEHGGVVVVTGQLPIDPVTFDAPLPRGITSQTRKTMDNLIHILEAMGCGVADILAARVFLTHFKRDYVRMNKEYRSYFAKDRLPARTCVGVTALARNALVEIDLMVVRSKRKRR